MRIAGSIACAALLCIACAEESTSKDRSSVTRPTGDAGTADAATEAGTPDPDDGRDEDPASCYAACSNTTFTCTSNDIAALAPEQTGCTGTIGPGPGGATKTLKLDCGAKKVCIDGTCIEGKFSAFTFAYTQGATEVICTRD